MSTENVASTVLLGMGKGSGIDIVKLAQDLTDVEKAPENHDSMPILRRVKRRYRPCSPQVQRTAAR